METPENSDAVPSKRGRPKKDKYFEAVAEENIARAKKARNNAKENPVVESFYELRGTKLCLCKRVKTGGVYRTLVGSTTDKERHAEITSFVKKLQKENRLRIKV
jgi:hypothetical protein